jgi:hypothetical protein
MRSPHPHALSGNIPARRLKVKFSLFCANQFTGAHGGEGHEFQRQPSDARPLINLPGCCWTSSGGEGGIRTPDTLTGMPDFESGAFNRALPPLRIYFRI